MIKKFLFTQLVIAFGALTAASPAQAVAGLTEAVYHNVPTTAYSPTDASISQVEAYFASATPNYVFVNSNDSFNYQNANQGSTNTYFGADAAGAALSDTASMVNSGFVATGYAMISQAGTYTFQLGTQFNQVDDAARIYIDGVVVAEQNFQANGSLGTGPTYTGSLSAGAHSFKFVYFQQSGGANLVYSTSGPAAVSYQSSVPEPASWAMMIGGFGLIGAALRRQRTSMRLA